MEDLCHFDDINKLINIACKSFIDHFNEKPTTAACAPGRVNLIGEHTDYSDGFVFPMVSMKVFYVTRLMYLSGNNKKFKAMYLQVN